MSTSDNPQHQFLESLLRACNKLRSAHWNAKRFHSKQAQDKEYRAGLELDKLLREENQRRKLPAQTANNE